MTTTGSWGFVLNGEAFGSPVGSDAYPDGLGEAVLVWLREMDLTTLRERVAGLRRLDINDQLSSEDLAPLQAFLDPDIIDELDSYLLEEVADGMEPGDALTAGAMFVDSNWNNCEWVYLVNLDNMTFEVHKELFGQRIRPLATGRLAGFGVHLLASWPLSELPDDGEQFDGVLRAANDRLPAA